MNKKDVNYNFHSLMLTIDQASQLTGVSKITLRNWERSLEGFLSEFQTLYGRPFSQRDA